MPSFSPPQIYSPPFALPRHDPYLKRPRKVAALFFSTTQVGWFYAFLYAVQHGQELTAGFSLLGLVGFFLMASRVGLVGHLALAIADHHAGLIYKPTTKEIVHRFFVGVVLPLLIMIWGVIVRQSEALLFSASFGLLCAEVLYRFGGYTSWTTPVIYRGALNKLMEGSARLAMEQLEQAPTLPPQDREATALAIATVAVRLDDSSILVDLEKYLSNWTESATNSEETQRARRTFSVVRADRARLENPEESGQEEAAALALVPSGHPRRLSLAMFVATAALDQGDGESAVKALELLHSRDVIPSTPRALVNWLMLKAYEAAGQTDKANRCISSLKTFNLPRLSENINWEDLNPLNNPYDRWILKARSDFQSEFPN